MATLARVFPALATVKRSDEEKVSLVNEGIVEEVLLELGELDFGKGVLAKCNVALWRTRGEHMPLVGDRLPGQVRSQRERSQQGEKAQ